MRMHIIRHVISLFMVLPLFSLRAGGAETGKSPNVVFILADDLGWAQTSPYGTNYYHTPNLDRLAHEGIRFTQAYAAAPVCSPTRASIMTGKYPGRLHLTDFIAGNDRDDYILRQPEWQKFLPLDETTIAEVFRERGYRTALFGKWHLSREKFGPESLPHYPDKQGFDDFFVIDKPDRKDNPEADPHKSDSIGNTSVKFIRKNAERPFFLFMSFSAIHNPLMDRADSISRFREVPGAGKPENNPVVAAMLSRLDNNIGKVLGTLDDLNLTGNTLVIFFSDNGGLASDAKQTPLRSGKGWLYEGGIRVPLIIRWPGVAAKNQTSDEVVISCDFMPFFCELLGTEVPENTDGVSFLPHLREGHTNPGRKVYWNYPHYHAGTGMTPAAAIRNGHWKLIEWYEKSLTGNHDHAYELFDLQNDQGETKNMADSLPALTVSLAKELKNWREEINAQLPQVKEQ